MTKKKKKREEEEETNLSVYNMLKNISLEVVTRHLQDIEHTEKHVVQYVLAQVG